MIMPEIACACGRTVKVELWHAGSRQECPNCRREVDVPSLDVLKRLAGDLHPELNDWQKLVVAIRNQEQPFDGSCVGCGVTECSRLVPVRLSVLSERYVSDDSPLGISPLGLEVQVSGGSEVWLSITIPFRFCPECYSAFFRSYWRGTVVRWLLVAFIVVFSFAAFWIALPCGMIGVGVTLVVLYRALSRWKKDLRFGAWLNRLPPVKRITDREPEYRLQKLPTVEL
jgi:hypothetical protein